MIMSKRFGIDTLHTASDDDDVVNNGKRKR